MKVAKLEQSIFYPDGEWYRSEKLGEGGFGAVHLAFFNAPHPCHYFRDFPPIAAVKSVRHGLAAELYWEKKVYNALRGCPFIVKYLGDDVTVADKYEYNDIDHTLIFNLFLEYAAGGTLLDLLNYSKQFLEPQARRFTRSIVGAIERIHREGFVHCDIKLENVLLVVEGGEYVAKVADMGLVKSVASEEETNPRGTLIYWAPEMVTDKVQEQAADIWALGCVVFGMLTGELPWDYCGDIPNELLEKEIATKSPMVPLGTFSDEAESFMNQCFRRDPRARPTAAELLRHPFVVGVDEEKNRKMNQSGWIVEQHHSHQVIVIDD